MFKLYYIALQANDTHLEQQVGTKKLIFSISTEHLLGLSILHINFGVPNTEIN